MNGHTSGRPSEARTQQCERPARPSREMAVDRPQAQRRDQRIGLRAEHVVEVVGDPEQRQTGERPGDVCRPAPLRRRAGQSVGDPGGEHHSAERDRDRGDHPQPQLVVAEQGVGQREQVGQRLPRRRRVGVERPLQGLAAPHQPAVWVEAGPRPRPHDEQRREQQHGDRDQRLGPRGGCRSPRRRSSRVACAGCGAGCCSNVGLATSVSAADRDAAPPQSEAQTCVDAVSETTRRGR